MPTGRVWQRLHSRIHEPIHFGKSGDNRFDAPDGKFGVLYLGSDINAAFVETFLRQPGETLISADDLRQRLRSEVSASRQLKLVRIMGDGLARIGATAVVSSGPYSLSQAWSLALWNHPEKPDGLLYRARHDDDRLCAAIFDRVGNVLSSATHGSLLEDPQELAALLDLYGVGLS